ncbi:hypothetical protein HE1_00266 [Holospora elegans E1]|uniref:Uncharacterized protein n=1 Tax=Holospora elegans E1 TaxID=1427503 RepID=A0A023DX79_9PROT|nr:hypothetical protein [Holospora elegans]GAJ45948.1 hypothetical protein HE1_00266 [Holospora elegans E1]
MQKFLKKNNRVTLRTQHRQEKNRRAADRLKDAYPKELNIHLILDQGPYNNKQRPPKSSERNGGLRCIPSLQAPT